MTVLVFACAGVRGPGGPESFSFVDHRDSPPELTFHLIDVLTQGPLQRLVRKELYGGQSAGAYLRRIAGEWRRDYRQVAEISSTQWSYEEDHNLVSSGRFVVIFQNVSLYQGGAHSLWYENACVIDMERTRRLFIKDLVTDPAALEDRADRELRRLSTALTGEALPPGTPLSRGIYFEDSFPLSEDFYPAENGLNFQWDPYEVAPYSSGGIEITLTWQELSALLSPLGKEMERLFKK